jgi:1,4-dihydroxy-2-naphthoate octaprenyltransferase
MTIVAVGFGIAYGYWSTGYIDVPLSVIAVIGSILLHALVNVTNDYFDYYRGVDRPGAGTTMYRPHPIVHGILSPRATLTLGITLGSLGLALAFLLALQGRLLAPLMGVLGFLLAYGYTGPPFNLKYRALGEASVFIAWGPLMSVGGYYVATGSTSFLEPALASIPIGSLVTSVLLANNLRDIKYDSEAGIKTLAIVLGRDLGLKL